MSLAIIKKSHDSMMERLKSAALQQTTSDFSEVVVLLTDCSASMDLPDCNGLRRIDAVANAAKQFVRACDSSLTMVGLALFNNSVYYYIEPTNQYGRVISGFYKAKPTLNTFLYSSVIWTSEQLGQFRVRVRRIICLSDGWSNDLHATIEQAIDSANRNRVIIDTVAFGVGADIECLRMLSERTGGVCKNVPLELETLAKTYKQLEVRIRGLLGSGEKR